MSAASFCCPTCQGSLETTPKQLRCTQCAREFAIVDGIADFFRIEAQDETVDTPNTAWLDPDIVEARDTVYRLCARELTGMIFCMQEMERRMRPGCRLLEVAMGTGHFTRWLAEISEPPTEVFAFDYSWPIIEKAKVNTAGLSNITLFRANARGALPFPPGFFDIVFLRLAPLGPHGTPNVKAALALLKPGGWFFEAGWEEQRYETAPTDWAIQHGFANAERHVWHYLRMQSEEERLAMNMELAYLASKGGGTSAASQGTSFEPENGGGVVSMTHEKLLIAQKAV